MAKSFGELKGYDIIEHAYDQVKAHRHPPVASNSVQRPRAAIPGILLDAAVPPSRALTMTKKIPPKSGSIAKNRHQIRIWRT